MTASRTLLADVHECKARLMHPPSHKLGAALAAIEDAAIRSSSSAAHHSLIWALGAAGRAAACDEAQGRRCLLDCARGHLDAALAQLRAEALGSGERGT